MHKENSPGREPAKKYQRTRIWLLNRYGVRTFGSRVAICFIAAALGISLILITVYIVIPGILQSISDEIDQRLAQKLYESTIVDVPENTVSPFPSLSAEPAFVQKTPGPVKTTSVPRIGFKDALAENPDVIGRISIDALGIDYLVVQSQDNQHYLKTGYNGKPSRNGAIFLDYRCNAKKEPLKGNYIVYGHNIKNGQMFHDLLKYKDKNFFNADRYIRFDTLYNDYTWEVFSVFVTPTSFDYLRTSFSDDDEWLEFIKTLQSKSTFKTDTVLSAEDVVLTLSTCANDSDDARFVVLARLVKQD